MQNPFCAYLLHLFSNFVLTAAMGWQVWRVAMLALRNLLTNDKLELGPEMVEAGLPKVVQQRKTQVQLLSTLHSPVSMHRHGPWCLNPPWHCAFVVSPLASDVCL